MLFGVSTVRSRVLVLVLALMTLSSPVHSQTQPIDPGPDDVIGPGTPLSQLPPALREAADQGLRTFKKLVTAQNFRRLGFESEAEIQQATLGEPLRDVYVPLDRLRAFTPGGDVKPLLVRGPRVVFPVLVANTVRSSFTVVELPGGALKAVSFGAQSFARSFSAARAAAAQANGIAPTSIVVVRVPALNAQSLGFQAAAGFSFVIVADDPRFDLRAGTTAPAAAVLERMVSRARSLRDDAPG
jgi:hypothetical protein